MSVLTYHFGGKSKLHDAAAASVAARLADCLSPARQIVARAVDASSAVQAWSETMAAVFDFFLKSDDALYARFVLRGRRLPIKISEDPLSRELDRLADDLANNARSISGAAKERSKLLAVTVVAHVFTGLFVAESMRRRSGCELDAAAVAELRRTTMATATMLLTELLQRRDIDVEPLPEPVRLRSGASCR